MTKKTKIVPLFPPPPSAEIIEFPAGKARQPNPENIRLPDWIGRDPEFVREWAKIMDRAHG